MADETSGPGLESPSASHRQAAGSGAMADETSGPGLESPSASHRQAAGSGATAGESSGPGLESPSASHRQAAGSGAMADETSGPGLESPSASDRQAGGSGATAGESSGPGLDTEPDESGHHRRRLSAREQFSISAFWFGVNLLWGSWLMIVLPSQMKRLAPAHPAETQGMILGWGAIPAVVVPLLAGALSDRCRSPWGRRRPYMLAGGLVNLAGLGLAWYAGSALSLSLFFAAYLIIQTGNNMATGAYSGVIPDLVPEPQRGEASGWMAAMSQLGTIAGAVSGGILLTRGMPGAAYAVIGASLAGSLCTTLAGIRETPIAACEARFNPRDFLRTLWIDPRLHPDFAWVWITRALVVMGLWTVQQYMQYYLADRIGIKTPEMIAGLVLTTGLICATITGVIGGKLSDRIGRKRVVYGANTIVAFSALAFVFAQSLSAVFIIGAIFGLGYGAYYSVDWALGCDVLPDKENAAKDMGVWHISMVLPQSIALPISGYVLGYFGVQMLPNAEGHLVAHYSAAGYTAIFSLAAAYLLLGAILLRNVRGVR